MERPRRGLQFIPRGDTPCIPVNVHMLLSRQSCVRRAYDRKFAELLSIPMTLVDVPARSGMESGALRPPTSPPRTLKNEQSALCSRFQARRA